jgi:hypothetical protein
MNEDSHARMLIGYVTEYYEHGAVIHALALRDNGHRPNVRSRKIVGKSSK